MSWSQFSLESEIQSAVRLDGALSVSKKRVHTGITSSKNRSALGMKSVKSIQRPSALSSTTSAALSSSHFSSSSMNISMNTSSMSKSQLDLSFNNPLNRSRSENRLHTSLFNGPSSSQSSNGSSKNSSSILLSQSISNGGGGGVSPSRGGSNLNSSLKNLSTIGGGDRFIPNRSAMDMSLIQHTIRNANQSKSNIDLTDTLANDFIDMNISNCKEMRQERAQQMAQIVFNDKSNIIPTTNGSKTEVASSRILSFKGQAPLHADESHINHNKVLFSASKFRPNSSDTNQSNLHASRHKRHVATQATAILDAPSLMDDFYLHLIAWSSKNQLAVGLHNSVFIWNADEGSIQELFTYEQNQDENEATVCCVEWSGDGAYLSVSDSNGNIEMWDVGRKQFLRSFKCKEEESGNSASASLEGRVATLAMNEHVLASGTSQGVVCLHDLRIAKHQIASLKSHSQEVCGMAWQPVPSSNLLATGSNDNLVLIWDNRHTQSPVHTFNHHLSAVKAMSWCIWQPHVLGTGGGTSDRTLKLWNTQAAPNTDATLIKSHDCGSQISAVIWNEEYKEVLTAHGYNTNMICLWAYPSMARVAQLQGHQGRVLCAVPSPGRTAIASAAADETIRIWKVWPGEQGGGQSGKSAKAKLSQAFSKSKSTSSIASTRNIR